MADDNLVNAMIGVMAITIPIVIGLVTIAFWFGKNHGRTDRLEKEVDKLRSKVEILNDNYNIVDRRLLAINTLLDTLVRMLKINE